MEAIPNRLNAVKSNEQTLLKIGCTMSQETKYLTQALRLFHRENSRVSPRIYLDDYFQLVNRLVENQLDFILGTKIMMQDRPECTFRKLSTSTTTPIRLVKYKTNSSNAITRLYCAVDSSKVSNEMH